MKPKQLDTIKKIINSQMKPLDTEISMKIERPAQIQLKLPRSSKIVKISKHQDVDVSFGGPQPSDEVQKSSEYDSNTFVKQIKLQANAASYTAEIAPQLFKYRGSFGIGREQSKSSLNGQIAEEESVKTSQAPPSVREPSEPSLKEEL